MGTKMSEENGILELKRFLVDRGIDAFFLPVQGACAYGMRGGKAAQKAHGCAVTRLTGFSGSSGLLVVRPLGKAMLFVDGRYTLQASAQTCVDDVCVCDSTLCGPLAWAQKELPVGAVLGFCSWFHTVQEIRGYQQAHGREWRLLFFEKLPWQSVNPADPLSEDEKRESGSGGEGDGGEGDGGLEFFPLERRSFQERCRACFEGLGEGECVLLSCEAELAWLTGLRGRDRMCAPLFNAYGLLERSCGDKFQLTLFLRVFSTDRVKRLEAEGRESGQAQALLEDGCSLAPLTHLVKELQACCEKGACVYYRAQNTPYGFMHRFPLMMWKPSLKEHNAIAQVRAVKTPQELEGMREAHRLDGMVWAHFLYWLSIIPRDGSQNEWSAMQKLEELRGALAGERYWGPSFSTISCFGKNSAMIHYGATPSSYALLHTGVYLVDAGGHYRYGTTDTTRVIYLGSHPPHDLCEAFTWVLKAHIALASAVFPKGARGVHVDVIGRNVLWRQGMDYPHATGHGVGAFSTVHEAPPYIALRDDMEPIMPCMVFSNEPGVYREGHFGVRLENVVCVRESGRFENFLELENLTLVPFDRSLILPSLLLPQEISWIDTYHQAVWDALSPSLPPQERSWLAAAVAPLEIYG